MTVTRKDRDITDFEPLPDNFKLVKSGHGWAIYAQLTRKRRVIRWLGKHVNVGNCCIVLFGVLICWMSYWGWVAMQQ